MPPPWKLRVLKLPLKALLVTCIAPPPTPAVRPLPKGGAAAGMCAVAGEHAAGDVHYAGHTAAGVPRDIIVESAVRDVAAPEDATAILNGDVTAEHCVRDVQAADGRRDGGNRNAAAGLVGKVVADFAVGDIQRDVCRAAAEDSDAPAETGGESGANGQTRECQ